MRIGIEWISEEQGIAADADMPLGERALGELLWQTDERWTLQMIFSSEPDVWFDYSKDDRVTVALAATIWIYEQKDPKRAPPTFALKNAPAWARTVAKVEAQSGLRYNRWEGKQFGAANRIYHATVKKYGTNVPEDY